MLIDAHCHLNFRAYASDAEAVISDMRQKGIRAVVVGSQESTSERAIALAREHPGQLYAAIALHPIHLYTMDVQGVEFPFTSREEKFNDTVYRKLAAQQGVVAIGECGLDYFQFPQGHTAESVKKKQKDILRKHIALAQDFDLPVILHVRANPNDYREPYRDALNILSDYSYRHVVFHALATHPDVAQEIFAQGYWASFSGLITYKEYPVLRELVRIAPLDRMMVETDSPYMTPEPLRGQRNIPQNVARVAQTVAQFRGVPIQEIEQATTAAAERFFRLPK